LPKILVVDDDRTMVTLLQTLLELEGFAVQATPLGLNALTMAREERPDVVLMDVHLADGDGLQALRQMRADPDLAGLRVIMTSGLDMIEEGRLAGGDDFILKPYAPDQLIAALKKVMER
jgi:DNA-binding response OmpR family regulator